MASAKNKAFVFVLFVLALAFGSVSFYNRDRIDFSLKRTLEYEEPYIVRDYGNLRYVLDKQRARIVVVDKKTNVVKNTTIQKSKLSNI